MPAPAAPPPAAPAAPPSAPEPEDVGEEAGEPEGVRETVAFPATGLGEYRMPADAPLVTLKTTAEVYRQDVDLIREHWDDLSDDELVEQAVREYAAMLGRSRHVRRADRPFCERKRHSRGIRSRPTTRPPIPVGRTAPIRRTDPVAPRRRTRRPRKPGRRPRAGGPC